MARGRGRGRARRPTRFADGSTAWAPSGQQEDTSSTPTRSVPQQEHTMDPTGSTPEMGAPEIGTSEGPSIQLEETISASQLMQMMVQQQAAAREDIMRMVEVQQQFLQQQLQQQQAMYQQQQQQQFQGTTAQPEHRVSLLDFQRYAPPAFKGTADPMEAVSWLKQMEKVFQALRCPDEEKVLFATFMLQGEAADWWEMEKGKLGPDDAPFIWEEFKKVFHEKYFPQGIRFQKYREFDRLEQGDMTVAQYAAKFEEMSRYAPTLISEESDRARKFENGLRGRIQQQVAAFELSSYKDVVNKALVIEKGLDNAQAAREKNMKKRFRSTDSPSQNSRPFKSKDQRPNQVVTRDKGQARSAIRCYRCGGPHLKRDCTWIGGPCFSCGQEGHKAVVCPSGKEQQRRQAPQSSQRAPGNRAPQEGQQQEGGQQRPRTQGRIYALTEQDAKASNSVVTGAL
ncbi:uncharacterized protein LOC120111162 [Phoenix dactylifera]|uniref:Uncharacterized protein LOC120111162 n=1 Tax=Phoenix dactylifera TaxID=42345 RepID=A0A8B9AD24_PHODC|nr:uncharacterized protein LOC120111162 [Phoenix dactylifera]